MLRPASASATAAWADAGRFESGKLDVVMYATEATEVRSATMTGGARTTAKPLSSGRLALRDPGPTGAPAFPPAVPDPPQGSDAGLTVILLLRAEIPRKGQPFASR